MQPVRSPRNPRVAGAVRLHRVRERRATGRTLIEGPHLLTEAVAAGTAVTTVFVLPDDTDSARPAAAAGAEVLVVTEEVLARAAPTRHPRGPLAVIEIPRGHTAGDRPTVVLWGVGDPGNAGSIIRSAAAFGFDVIAGPDTTDCWSPKVLRAGAGAHFRTTVEVGGSLSLAELTGRGFTTVAAVVQGGVAPERLRDGRPALLAVLVGDEAHGLPSDVAAGADRRVTIAMPGGVESLNAAVSAAILLYELGRGKGAGAGAGGD